MTRQAIPFLSVLLFTALTSCAQVLNHKQVYSRQDTLRGSVTSARAWWDVVSYAISVTPDFNSKTLEGKNEIRFKVLSTGRRMQVDLQQPMKIEQASWNNQALPLQREGNVYYVTFPQALKAGAIEKLTIAYSGKPREARNAPWDGGWIWRRDAQGRPWMTVACQGLGASVWYPCKDYQGDEPDSAALNITVPDTLVAVGNGRLRGKETAGNGLMTYHWAVVNPINNYDIIPYIGKYVNFTETYQGEKGPLNCSYWVLDYNLDKAKKQFVQAQQTLQSHEYWFGPYPWYEDDFKLVEAPHLGMEHQSAVAYGNKYQNGYLGSDLSGTGWGLKWDFIIVHEVGHEWFGNSLTTRDIADMWVHEGFTDYSEALFIETFWGKKAADEYVQGLRSKIENDVPIIGPYGVNKEGSSDMYYKGANLLHTIRQVINDDEKFRGILRGLNKTFYHQTVTSRQVEDYISRQSGRDFSKVFDQYLRTTEVPQLKLDVDGGTLKYKWDDTVRGFAMPVRLTNGQWITPSDKWQALKMDHQAALKVSADPNFYIRVKKDD